MMTERGELDGFVAALDRYGPDFDRWPPADAAQGRALLIADPEARAAWRAARIVGDALSDAMERGPPPGLPGRVLAGVARRRGLQMPWQLSWRLAPVGAALMAASLGFGILLGASLPSTQDDDDGLVEVAVLMDAGPDLPDEGL